MVVPEPRLELQQHFSTLVQSFRSVSRNIEIATDSLERLFKTLLHRAFTGELTAKWRQAHLKELLTEIERQARLLETLPDE